MVEPIITERQATYLEMSDFDPVPTRVDVVSNTGGHGKYNNW